MIAARPLGPRRRPLWLVAALTVMTLGVYMPIWVGLSWGELRRETKDEAVSLSSPLAPTSPVWQALSVMIPIYGSFRVYRQFALISRLLERANAGWRVDPLSAALGVGVWWVTWLHYSSEPVFMALNAIELAAATAVVVYGQRALNIYWRVRPGEPVEERVLETDWFVLAAAAVYFVVSLMSYATAATN